MTYDIIFEWTERSTHAIQGAAPSGQAGYNIWIRYSDNEVVDFLGFITQDRLYEEMEHYKSLGITPKMRGVDNGRPRILLYRST